MLVRKTDFSFDLDEIRTDVYSILEKYDLPQVGLMHSESAEGYDKILDATGQKNTGPGLIQLNQDTYFSVFNEEFLNTSIYRMYKSLLPHMNICRLRIMTMTGPSCYFTHRDKYVRYHLAIDTTPECMFLFPEQKLMEHIPNDGYIYFTDTRYPHTFINASRKKRIHLVFGSTN